MASTTRPTRHSIRAGRFRRAVVLFLTAASAGVAQLAAPPPGSTLPVVLDATLDAQTAKPGAPVRAHLAQRVPLPGGAFLPEKARLLGTIASVDAQSLTLRLDTLSLDGQAMPIHVKLLAGAFWRETEFTKDPLGGSGRGTGNPTQWTTRQIGGDEVYRANSIAKVYNRVSEPVGRADGTGVYGFPSRPGGLERALGSFSTTATGLYGFKDLRLGAQTPGTITFQITGPRWSLHTHDGLPLEVVP